MTSLFVITEFVITEFDCIAVIPNLDNPWLTITLFGGTLGYAEIGLKVNESDN